MPPPVFKQICERILLICESICIFDEKDLSNFKCLIIDDDPQITELVMYFSEKSALVDYCVCCTDPVEGVKLLANSKFDVLFLDYNMPVLNGQDILEIKKDACKVIMITSNTNFAVTTYKYDTVVDYLLKPLSYESFEASLIRVCQKLEEETNKNNEIDATSVLIKDGSNWIPVQYESIFFIKSDSNYCSFYTENGIVMTLAKLTDLQEKLPQQFIRCHRSYVINTKLLTQINLEEVKINDTTIPVSSSYKETIKQFIQSKL